MFAIRNVVVAVGLLVVLGAAQVLAAAGTHAGPGAVQAGPPPGVLEANGSAAPAPPEPSDRSPPQSGEAAAPLRADFRATLSQYGTFVQHPKYGEVWLPSAAPQGWHPYPPCHWVNARRSGWTFDDRTPWGAIVHHYGRWTHDEQAGWIWVPDDHYSPGWVVWRTSPQWVGWAPMPPDADIRLISTDTFDNGGFWIFLEAARFVSGCADDAALPESRTPDLIKQTQYVTQIAYVEGIAIVQLPSYVAGPVVDVDVTAEPWPAWFFVNVIGNWNWVWSKLTVVVNVVDDCPPR